MTELYRRFDPQTRRLAYVVPSAAGGTISDDNAVRLHFLYDGFDPGQYNSYIVFNVKTAMGDNYTFSPTTEPSFDGRLFVIPNEVMAKAKKNKLGYQLVFVKYDANTGQSEEIHSAIDFIQVMASLDIPASMDTGLEARVARLEQDALIRPVELDGGTLVFNSVNLAPASTIDLGEEFPRKLSEEREVYSDGSAVITINHDLHEIPSAVTVLERGGDPGAYVYSPVGVMYDADETSITLRFLTAPSYGTTFIIKALI